MKKYLIYLAALMVAMVSSCKETDSPIDPKEEPGLLPKHSVNIDLSGTFSNSEGDVLRAHMTPTEDGDIKITFDDNELMKDGVDPITGKAKRVKSANTGKLTLFFVEKSKPSKVEEVVVEPTDFRKNDDGSYTIEYSGTVSLSGDFDSGEWYVSGGYRLQKTGSLDENLPLVGGTYVNTQGEIQAIDRTNDFKLPFVFGWTKLTTRTDNPSLASNHAQQFALKFKPDGYMLRYRIINNLVEDIKLGVVTLYSERLSLGRGPFAYTYPSTDNFATDNLPRISTPIDATNSKRNAVVGIEPVGTDLTSGWGTGRVLAPGEYITNYIRFNNPGTPVAKGASFMRFQFGTIYFPQGQTAGGTQLDAREIEGMPAPELTKFFKGDTRLPLQPKGYIMDVWRGASLQDFVGYNKAATEAERHTLGLRNMYLPENTTLSKKGTVNNVNYKVNSDLMITELYTTRYSDERSGSFGLIEIYNPTLDPIDLSKYGLMRFGYRNDGGTYKVRNLPSTNEIAVPSNVNAGSALLSGIEEALVLPLDLKSGAPSGDWEVNSFNRPVREALVPDNQYCYPQSIQYVRDSKEAFVGSSTKHTGFEAKVVDFSGKGYIQGLKAITPGATTIGPGKTLIILFGGYASDNFAPNEEDQKIFAKIRAAVQAGYCDHVVAIAHGNSTAKPYEAQAGVTTADLGDAFSLVRIARVPNVVQYGADQGPADYNRIATRVFVDGTWNSRVFDGSGVVKGFIESGAKAIIRRPYGPYLWNTGFQAPDDASRYYQREYSIDKATFGAPYFSSYEAGNSWSAVVQPRITKRDASLFKRKK